MNRKEIHSLIPHRYRRVPDWLAANPGWHRWEDVCKRVAGYSGGGDRPYRLLLEKGGLIRAATVPNGNNRKVLMVAAKDETNDPPDHFQTATVTDAPTAPAPTPPAPGAGATASATTIAEFVALLQIADVLALLRKMDAHAKITAQAAERIAGAMEQIAGGAILYEPVRNGAPS